ncbi:unnamed protein product [Tuber melanosporum]|uniref:(Perigord truffle) hypothetical protein n=1 Tax=Tuber melanosporum (strain Mel28) TaxID=656061 RepID=D5GD19_TUBMM|nr:uncharacterized protein GSTUM_00000937001 [Tuber melanosporum]CAZ82412.1 unnamed protein product [Tuber melanosporum]
MASSKIKPSQLADAVLSSVLDGSYPDSDDVAGAVLEASALPEIIAPLQKARESLYDGVRTVSRESGPEVDSWISQARGLHKDIESSKTKADEIVQLAEQEKRLNLELEDSIMQARLLVSEINFNEALAEILSKLQLIDLTLYQVKHLLNTGELCQAIEALDNVEVALEKLPVSGETIVISLMKEKAKGLRSMLVNKLEDCWRYLLRINPGKGGISIDRDAAGSCPLVESVIEALKKLDLLNGKIDHLHHQIDKLLVAPRFDSIKGSAPTFSVAGNSICMGGNTNDLSATRMFNDLRQLITFFNRNLPSGITPLFSRIFIANLTTRLMSSLSSSVPSSLDDLPKFEALLKETREFEKFLHQISWTKETELREWTERAPKVWLSKRKETSLDKARQILSRGTSDVKVVERTETQEMKVASPTERRKSVGAPMDVWNDDCGWGYEDAPVDTAAAADSLQIDMDDDDASGWGLDEDIDIEDEEQKDEKSSQPVDVPTEEDGLDNLDWGEWGEDDPGIEARESMAASDTAPAKKPTESKPAIRYSSSHSGDITLRESYTITSIPDAIMEIIVRVADEAKRLSNMPPSAVTPAASGMLSIPSLVLAAYRALAPTSYPTNISSNMYVYNDCVRIAEQLQDLEVTVELTHPNNNWDTDINIIQSFGKRHYSKEIGLQRTVLCDFLDGAKGFVGCTNFPQSADCQTAISSVVARINGIYTSWSQVLSPSVLFQSVGLLLNTVVTKLINDIEDIPDIPAADSEKICTFFEEIATLESLFPDAPGGAGVSTTGFHCKNWLKFRFLQQILDSRIADILYMFREGHLEGFETEELVDLVKALFADNDNRKKCIDEIRSGGH